MQNIIMWKKESHSYLHFTMSRSFVTIKFRIHFSSILSLVHINLKCSTMCTARVVRYCDSLHSWKSICVTWRTSMERKLCLIDKNDIKMSIILIVCKTGTYFALIYVPGKIIEQLCYQTILFCRAIRFQFAVCNWKISFLLEFAVHKSICIIQIWG